MNQTNVLLSWRITKKTLLNLSVWLRGQEVIPGIMLFRMGLNSEIYLKCICINNLKGTNSLLSQSDTHISFWELENQHPTLEKGWEQSIDKV